MEGVSKLTGKPFISNGGGNGGTEPISPLTGKPYLKDAAALDTPINPMFIPNLQERSRLGVSIDPEKLNYAADLAIATPTRELLGKSLEGFGRQALAGVAMNFAGYDAKGIMNAATGATAEYGNALYDFAERQLAQVPQIYTLNRPGSFDPGDPAWWGTQVQSLGLSVGIAASTFLESAAISAVTAGVGTEVSIANLANVGSKVSKAKTLANFLKLDKVIGNVGAKSKFYLQNAGHGAFKGIQESYIESIDSYDNIYKELVEKGIDEEAAKKYAAIGASNTFNSGVLAVMAMNSLQMMTLAYNPSTKATSNIFENSIKNKFIAKGANLGFESASESLEEGLQTIIQNESGYKADMLAGTTTASSFSQRLNEMKRSGELYNAMAGGALGGVAFTAIGEGSNMIRGVLDKNNPMKVYNAAHGQLIDKMQGISLDYLKQIKKAEDDGDFDRALYLRKDMSVNKAVQALHLDNVTGKDSAFDTYKDHLEKVHELAVRGDVEGLEKLGLGGADIDHIKKNFPDLIKDANKTKQYFEEAKQEHRAEAIPSIVQRRVTIDTLEDEIKRIENNISTSALPEYGRMTSYAKETFQLQVQLDKMKEIRRNINNYEGITEEEIKAVDTSIAFFQSKIKDTKDERTEVEKVQDQAVLDNIKNRKQYKKDLQQLPELKVALLRTRKELAKWEDKDFQAQTVQNEIYDKVNGANTLEEIKAVREYLEQNKVLTSEAAQKLNAKEAKIKAKIKAREGKKAPTPTATNTATGAPITNTTNTQTTTTTPNTPAGTSDTTTNPLVTPKEDISVEEQGSFVSTGKVTEDRKALIADKLRKGLGLSKIETTMYETIKSDIQYMLTKEYEGLRQRADELSTKGDSYIKGKAQSLMDSEGKTKAEATAQASKEWSYTHEGMAFTNLAKEMENIRMITNDPFLQDKTQFEEKIIETNKSDTIPNAPPTVGDVPALPFGLVAADSTEGMLDTVTQNEMDDLLGSFPIPEAPEDSSHAPLIDFNNPELQAQAANIKTKLARTEQAI